MEHWKRTIEAGNRLFALGDWVEARELYLQALAEAQILFTRWRVYDEAVAAFVVSHHNLADLHLMLGQPEESAENLYACHERLLRTAADEHLPLGLREAALIQSRRTYRELLGFIGEHAAYRRSDRLLAAPTASRVAPAAAQRHYH